MRRALTYTLPDTSSCTVTSDLLDPRSNNEIPRMEDAVDEKNGCDEEEAEVDETNDDNEAPTKTQMRSSKKSKPTSSHATKGPNNSCVLSHMPPAQIRASRTPGKKSRKDIIKRHLEKVKCNGGDEQHRLDDPLWHTFEVVWFLTPRPKFTAKKRRLAKGTAQSRYYQKRKFIQETHEAEMKRRLDEGAISEEQYKKYLMVTKGESSLRRGQRKEGSEQKCRRK